MSRNYFFSTILAFILFANGASLAASSSHQAAVENSLVPMDPRGPQKQENIQQRMRELAIPGVSITVINNGQIEWSKGYGEFDNPKYLTQAASISKTVAALTILSLIQEGKIDLDTDVSDILGKDLWSKIDPRGLADSEHKVTIRRLLSHTAGTTVSGFKGYPRNQQKLPSVDEILLGKGNSPPVEVDFLPGTRFAYSGGGTTILQKVVEVVTGKPFSEAVSERVFSKLDMQDSTYYPKEDQMIHGNGPDGTPIPGGSHVYPELAAAGLWTTSKDLAKMAIAIQKSLAGEKGSVFDQKLIQEMLLPQTAGRANGLGVFVHKLLHSLVFSHPGGNTGFRCIMIANNHGQGAVIMTNSDHGEALQTEILTAIAKEYGWPDAEQIPQCNPPFHLKEASPIDVKAVGAERAH